MVNVRIVTSVFLLTNANFRTQTRDRKTFTNESTYQL